MTEPTPFLHLTILADGQPVHRETVDVRDLARTIEDLAEGHHKIAERLVAEGHVVQVRLADPDGLAGTAVIDMDAGGTVWRIVDVDPGVDAAWRAWRRSGRTGAPPAEGFSVSPPRPPGAAGPGVPSDPGASTEGGE
jgi:hypothetical protein